MTTKPVSYWDIAQNPARRFSAAQITAFCVSCLAITGLCQLYIIYRVRPDEDRFTLHPFVMYVFYMFLVSFGCSVCIKVCSPEWLVCVVTFLLSLISVGDLIQGAPDYPFKLLLRAVTGAGLLLVNGWLGSLCYRAVRYCARFCRKQENAADPLRTVELTESDAINR